MKNGMGVEESDFRASWSDFAPPPGDAAKLAMKISRRIRIDIEAERSRKMNRLFAVLILPVVLFLTFISGLIPGTSDINFIGLLISNDFLSLVVVFLAPAIIASPLLLLIVPRQVRRRVL